MALLVAGAIACASATSAGAGYTQLFKPVFGPAAADPCEQMGIGTDGGIAVRTQPDTVVPSIKRFVAMVCGPRRSIPLSTLLVDDQIWQFTLGNGGHTATHMLAGGLDPAPWNASVSTKNYPYVKGPAGHAPGLDPAQLQADPVLIDSMLDLIKEQLTEPGLGVAAVFCILGALESAGATCEDFLISAGIVVLVAAGFFIAELADLVARFIERGLDMEQSDWFYWSDGTGFWNGLGDVNPNFINPSIYLADPFSSHDARIGVVFSNVALDQGPDFGSSGGTRVRGRHLYGSKRNQTLIGTKLEDFIEGGAGNDAIHGRGGNDILLQGGTGNDHVYGGKGADNIDGYRGRDLLVGGPGNDDIIDVYGPTTVHAGSGENLVNVRDGRADDRVDCIGSTRNIIQADRGDRIDRSCRVGKSRIIRNGRRMKIGVGY